MAKKQLPIRVSEDLHDEIKRAAFQQGVSRERFLRETVLRELARLKPLVGGVSRLTASQQVAFRFLLHLPTPLAIKDHQARIVWANPCYEDVTGYSLADLRGRSFRELGLLSWEGEAIERDIRASLERSPASGTWYLEPILVAERKRLFGTVRFAFVGASSSHRMLGDISFEWEQIRSGQHNVPGERLKRILVAEPSLGLGALFESFLERCPVAIAIKTDADVIHYCNDVYARLCRRPRSRVIGRTSKEVFDLPDSHSVLLGDAAVLAHNQWMFTHDLIGNKGPRVSLRFPICSPSGTPEYVGVISTTIGTSEHPLVFSSRQPSRVGARRPAARATGGRRSSEKRTTRR